MTYRWRYAELVIADLIDHGGIVGCRIVQPDLERARMLLDGLICCFMALSFPRIKVLTSYIRINGTKVDIIFSFSLIFHSFCLFCLLFRLFSTYFHKLWVKYTFFRFMSRHLNVFSILSNRKRCIPLQKGSYVWEYKRNEENL